MKTNKKDDKRKRGDAMEEEFKGVLGESSKEVVEREIGEEAVRARAMKTETVPSQKEVEEHNLDHGVFRSWCPHCVKGWAKSHEHVRRVQGEGGLHVHSQRTREGGREIYADSRSKGQ